MTPQKKEPFDWKDFLIIPGFWLACLTVAYFLFLFVVWVKSNYP